MRLPNTCERVLRTFILLYIVDTETLSVTSPEAGSKAEHLPPQPLVMLSAGLSRCPSNTKPLPCTSWCVLCPNEGPKSTNSSVHEQISPCIHVPFLILTPESQYPHLENVLIFMLKVFTWTAWKIGLHWNVHALDSWIFWKQWGWMINLERKIGSPGLSLLNVWFQYMDYFSH